MNIINFLLQELNNTKNHIKMLQASLYTLNDCVNLLELNSEKQELIEEITNLEIYNDDLLENIDKLITKSSSFI